MPPTFPTAAKPLTSPSTPMAEDPQTIVHELDPPPPGRGPKKVGVWVGVGCLGVLVLSCCMLAYWAQTFGLQWVLKQSDETKLFVSRVVLAGALENVRATCEGGKPTGKAESWLHSALTPADRDRLCTVDEAAIQRIADPEQTPAQTLTAIGQPEIAERLGLDPTLCFRYELEAFDIVGCFDPDTEGAVPYKIISVEPTTA